MSRRREPPFAWCEALARANAEHLGAAMAQAAERVRARAPGFVRLAYRLAEEPDADVPGARWWLHVAVVFEGEVARAREAVEDTHPALAREVQRAAVRWSSAWPILHRHSEGDAALAAFTPARVDLELPAPPAPPPPVGAAPAGERDAKPPKAPAAPAPAPRAAAEPTAQRSLFG